MPEALRTPVEFGRRLVDHLKTDDVIGLAAELAYRFFLAVFPFAIFLTALGGAVARALAIENPAEQAVDLLSDALPPEAARLVGQELRNVVENETPGLMSVGALAALWFATGGTNTIIKASNRVYAAEESRPFWKRYLLALAMTLLAGAAIVGAFVLFFAGRVVGEDLAARLGLGEVWWLVTVLRWPFIALLLILGVSVLYRLAPSLRSPPRWILPGAILFTAGWIVATVLFGIYVANFANYAGTYGALGGVVILLIWFYLTSLLLLLGLEVNEVIAEMRDPQLLKELRREAADDEDGGARRRDEDRRLRRDGRDPREERGREERAREDRTPGDRRREPHEGEEEGAAPA